MPLADDLFAVDEQLDRAIGTLGEAFYDLATRQARAWWRTAADVVHGLPTTSQGRFQRRGRPQLATALETTDQRYRTAIGKALDRFADVSRHATRALGLTGVSRQLTPAAVEALNAYRSLKLAEFDGLRASLFARTTQATRQAVASGQDVTELLVELRELFDEWPWRARTIYESALAEFSQVVTAVKAGTGGDRVYLYTGPVDSRIRRFCLGLAGRVLSRSAIDKLDNGQTPNTFLTRGGYNCRHQWRDVTGIPELARLAGSKTRASRAIAARVTALGTPKRGKGST
jgi:hypothetical protein